MPNYTPPNVMALEKLKARLGNDRGLDDALKSALLEDIAHFPKSNLSSLKQALMKLQAEDANK